MKNRHGLIVDCALTLATRKAEAEAALGLLTGERAKRRRRMTVPADRGHNTKTFAGEARALRVTSHVPEKKRYSVIDGRTASWDGYQTSGRRRKIVKEPFGWMKTVGGLHKLRHRGEEKIRAVFTLTYSCFNLVRLRNLGAQLCST